MNKEKVYKIKCKFLENTLSNKIVESIDTVNLDNTINYSITIKVNKNNYNNKKNEVEALLSSILDNTIKAFENMGLNIKEANIVGCILEEIDYVIITLNKSNKKSSDLTVKSVIPDQEYLLDKLLIFFQKKLKEKKKLKNF